MIYMEVGVYMTLFPYAKVCICIIYVHAYMYVYINSNDKVMSFKSTFSNTS